jgi:hypothetical protein
MTSGRVIKVAVQTLLNIGGMFDNLRDYQQQIVWVTAMNF